MFYTQFINLCELKGVSPTRACKECGVSHTAWNKWKAGGTPNAGTLAKLSSYFGVPISDLLYGESEKPSSEETSDDFFNMLEFLRRSPEFRTMFSLAKSADEKTLKQMVAVIKALKGADE